MWLWWMEMMQSAKRNLAMPCSRPDDVLVLCCESREQRDMLPFICE